MSWIENIKNYFTRSRSTSQPYDYDNHFKADEVGFTHPVRGSCVKLKDDGSIDLFSGPYVGARMNPDGGMNLYGDKLHIKAHSIYFETGDIFWNGMSMDAPTGSATDTLVRIAGDAFNWVQGAAEKYSEGSTTGNTLITRRTHTGSSTGPGIRPR